jgi:hypothetical protein
MRVLPPASADNVREAWVVCIDDTGTEVWSWAVRGAGHSTAYDTVTVGDSVFVALENDGEWV